MSEPCSHGRATRIGTEGIWRCDECRAYFRWEHDGNETLRLVELPRGQAETILGFYGNR